MNFQIQTNQYKTYGISMLLLMFSLMSHAEILPQAEVGVKIPLAKTPTTRPITVAYMPQYDTYYVADGGLAPMASAYEAPSSKSEVHTYKSDGTYLNSARPGMNNRSIYFNPNTNKLEIITYNVSADLGFGPNTGIFAVETDDSGKITNQSEQIIQSHSAFGSGVTIPSYDAENKRYFAKQERSNIVLIVSLEKEEPLGKIELDLAKAGAATDDISSHFIAYSGIKGEELVLLDVDHKAALIFNLDGEFVGKSALPQHMKLFSKNHYNGLGYANGMLFVYHEREGEFGTYYGLKVVK